MFHHFVTKKAPQVFKEWEIIRKKKMKITIKQTTTKRLTVGSDGVVYATMTKKDKYGSTTVTRRVKDVKMANTIKSAHGNPLEEEKMIKFITKENLIEKFKKEKTQTLPQSVKCIEYIDLTNI